MVNKNIGLYIHVPFCKAKCYYCDFNSYPGRESKAVSYFEALSAEIGYWSGKLKETEVKTIFIGGGTPSLVEADLITALLDSCRKHFNISLKAEITIESNPGTLNSEKLEAYRTCGINRLSVGLQAWQDRLLKELGRIHSKGEFLENLKAAHAAGFENINVDLIFGLPGQTMEEWKETVINVAGLGITHISCYDLKIEEGTIFGDRLEKGLLLEMEDELDRDMYHYAVEKLADFGYRHYEISNFALPGCECRHNLVYWKAEEYVGLGAGAHSYLFDQRYNNVYGIEEYINGASDLHENYTYIDKSESMSEFMILGLRLTEGVSPAYFKTRYGEDMHTLYGKQISKLIGKGLLKQEGDRIKLTVLGLDIANSVFVEFV